MPRRRAGDWAALPHRIPSRRSAQRCCTTPRLPAGPLPCRRSGIKAKATGIAPIGLPRRRPTLKGRGCMRICTAPKATLPTPSTGTAAPAENHRQHPWTTNSPRLRRRSWPRFRGLENADEHAPDRADHSRHRCDRRHRQRDGPGTRPPRRPCSAIARRRRDHRERRTRLCATTELRQCVRSCPAAQAGDRTAMPFR